MNIIRDYEDYSILNNVDNTQKKILKLVLEHIKKVNNSINNNNFKFKFNTDTKLITHNLKNKQHILQNTKDKQNYSILGYKYFINIILIIFILLGIYKIYEVINDFLHFLP